MPSTPSFALATTQLVYYTPTLFPLAYVLYSHRHNGFLGWTFLFVYILLQITGSALTASEGGHMTATAAILTGVGISPLLLGTAGILHEIADGIASKPKAKSEKKKGVVLVLFYHIFVVTGVALYAVGKRKTASIPPEPDGKVLGEVGVIILLTAWIILAGVCLLISRNMNGKREWRPLIIAVQVSVILLGVRLVYACVATFSTARVFDVVGGSIALKIVFEFLIGAVVIAGLITGGVLTHRVGMERIF